MFDSLLSFIEKYVPLSTREKEIIIDAFSYREVPDKHKLVEIGKVSHELYFIKKGCGRLYYLKNGVEVSGFLFTENMFIGSLESFLSKKPSIQIIEMVEPSELFVINNEKLDRLYLEIPKMNIFIRELLSERLITAQNLVASFVLDKPEERYTALIATNPQLLNRFPQQTLATFLGITPVSLSRIRKRIIKSQ